MADRYDWATGLLSARLARPTVIVRPIARVSLRLTDRDAFSSAIEQTVRWLARRAETKMPTAAFQGEPFDLTAHPKANPTIAVRTAIEGIDIWAARNIYPDAAVAQRTWVTDVTVATGGGLVEFHARLSNITKGSDVNFTNSRPGIVHQIISNLSAQVDNVQVTDDIWIIDNNEYTYFRDLLLSRNRAAPIIALSVVDDRPVGIDAAILLKRLSGTAHIVRIESDASWLLTGDLGRKWSVFNSATRIYWPIPNIDSDDPRRHQLYLSQEGVYAPLLVDEIANLILPFSCRTERSDDRLLAFDAVRAQSTDVLRAKARAEGISAENEVKELSNEVNILRQQIAQDALAQDQLIGEAQEISTRAENDRAIAWAVAAGLRHRVRYLEEVIDGRRSLTYPSALNDYKDLESWANENLAGSIELLPRAIKEAKRNGSPDLIDKVADALIILRDKYVPMRRRPGGDAQEEFESALAENALELAPCFANLNDAKNFPEYYVRRDGKRQLLDLHLKYRSGYDPRFMFRIYFFWDDEDEVLVVGHMPIHLDNNLTN